MRAEFDRADERVAQAIDDAEASYRARLEPAQVAWEEERRTQEQALAALNARLGGTEAAAAQEYVAAVERHEQAVAELRREHEAQLAEARASAERAASEAAEALVELRQVLLADAEESGRRSRRRRRRVRRSCMRS